jgi:hypothetical protein
MSIGRFFLDRAFFMILRRFIASCWDCGTSAFRYGSRSFHCKRTRVRDVGIQSMHQRWPLLHDPYTRVTTTVNPTLVTLRYTKPTLQIQIVRLSLKLTLTHKQTTKKTLHHTSHLLVNRILALLESNDQFLEPRLPDHTTAASGFKGRRDFLDLLDVPSDPLVFRPHGVETSVDATGQAAKLLLCEPPFPTSKFR